MKNRFENLEVWKKGRELYSLISEKFGTNFKEYFFKDQILRATLSITNNIAEGFERQTKKECLQFLYIAKGSAGEVRSMIYIALDKKYITDQEFEDFLQQSEIISKMLYKLIEHNTKE